MTAAKKEMTKSRILYAEQSFTHTAHYLFYIQVIWRPNHRRLKTGNEKGETSQLLQRYLQSKDRIAKKAKATHVTRETSNEKQTKKPQKVC